MRTVGRSAKKCPDGHNPSGHFSSIANVYRLRADGAARKVTGN
jgi:hypothetical protein